MMDDDMFNMVDDDAIEEHRQERAKRAAEREARIASGVDPSVAGATEAAGDGDAKKVSEMSTEEREARWGFTHEELTAATKVAYILFHKPQLYVGDPYLAESRLYTMISRDRKAKRDNKDSFKKVMNQEKSRKEQKKKEEDLHTMRKTQMKKDRDAALNKLLLPPEESDEEDDVPLIEDKSTPGSGETGVKKDAEATDVALEGGEKKEQEQQQLGLNRTRKCHTCKEKYKELHHFYYSLCPTCGELNFRKRSQSRDLRGKYVLLTGCRIKIGYAMALSLLRNGAILLGTTRFAHDAVSRFQQEEDYEEWAGRLHLFSLDMRDLWMVTQFCGFLQAKFPFLFAIVNNAAQTIARTPEYTERLRQQEVDPTPKQIQAVKGQEASGQWRDFFMANSSVAVGQPTTLEYHPDEVDGKVFDAEEAAAKTKKEASASAAAGASGTAKHADPNSSEGPSSGGSNPTNVPKDANDLGATTEAAKNAAAHLENSEKKLAKTYDRYDTVFELSDQRTTNSWTMNMGEITGAEASEVMAINALAPFIINSKLKAMLLKDDPAVAQKKAAAATANTTSTTAGGDEEDASEEPSVVADSDRKKKQQNAKKSGGRRKKDDDEENRRENRFIINVSAMEGQFYRFKQTTHPHTNMAKAALNMMTRTSGADYAKDHIYMNSVDTGWITDESPLEKKERRGTDFQQCPLDEVDAAARCLDLIYTNSTEHGQFWKDYHPIPW